MMSLLTSVDEEVDGDVVTLFRFTRADVSVSVKLMICGQEW